MKKLDLNEHFISRIWENQDYFNNLKTTDERKIEIINYGKKNVGFAGADYNNARLKIGDVTFSGDVEIHRTFRDWNLHKHNINGKYNRVILNIVMWGETDNVLPKTKYTREVPTLILSDFLSMSIHKIWKDIINNPSSEFRLPCQKTNQDLLNEFKEKWIKDMGITRLNYRANRLKIRLEELSNPADLSFSYPKSKQMVLKTSVNYKKLMWEKVLFEYICEALGFSKNKKQFLKLAKNIDFDILKKYKLDLNQLDAVLFAVAGFLSTRLEDKRLEGLNKKSKIIDDVYVEQLIKSWELIKPFFNVEIMNYNEWNFFRMRPANFPMVGIGFASGLLYSLIYDELLKKIVLLIENSNNITKDIIFMFKNIKCSEYWHKHYCLGIESSYKSYLIGQDKIQSIIINVICPFILLYSRVYAKAELYDRIIKYYNSEKLKEKNEVVRAMQNQLNYKPKSASEFQGLIHLHNFYCIKGKCNECKIGEAIFARESTDYLRIILY